VTKGYPADRREVLIPFSRADVCKRRSHKEGAERRKISL
jgi:hypothetical protein